MRHILVTGGAGFIGSNFIPYFLSKHTDCHLINLDALTYAGRQENLREVEDHPRYTFVEGDIQNRELLTFLFRQYDIRGVVHFAAESHVDNSIDGPEAFVRTNVLGTFTLLDVARHHWMSAPFAFRSGYEEARFLHVSTDEVYGSLGETGHFTESTPYAPNSPYSASKAASDMIVRSYHHTYGMNLVTTNCSNNFGPKQHEEKLIPVVIRKAISQEPIPIYGDGKNVRDWLYVLDHASGIEAAFERGRSGEVYNIGSRNEQGNLQLVHQICDLLDKIRPLDGKSYRSFITFVKDRPGHDRRYAIDPTKLETELNWKPQADFQNSLKETITWYLAYFERSERQPVQPPAQKAATSESGSTAVPDFEKQYAPFFSARDLDQALEGLAEIEASLTRSRREYEASSQKAKDWENKAFLVMQRAKTGDMAQEDADELAMEILKEQQRAEEQAKRAFRSVSELERLKARMQENVEKIKTLKESYHRRVVNIPDSSETISMIERMKEKVLKNEILGDLYAQEGQLEDPELDKKVNDALGIDPKKEALNKFKSERGL